MDEMTTAKKMPDNGTYSGATTGYRAEVWARADWLRSLIDAGKEEEAIEDRAAPQPTISQDGGRAAA